MTDEPGSFCHGLSRRSRLKCSPTILSSVLPSTFLLLNLLPVDSHCFSCCCFCSCILESWNSWNIFMLIHLQDRSRTAVETRFFREQHQNESRARGSSKSSTIATQNNTSSIETGRTGSSMFECYTSRRATDRPTEGSWKRRESIYSRWA